jgi:hypothetical protein
MYGITVYYGTETVPGIIGITLQRVNSQVHSHARQQMSGQQRTYQVKKPINQASGAVVISVRIVQKNPGKMGNAPVSQ